MAGQKLRVGIVGLKADRGWASTAHLPALRALSDDFEVIGVANSSHESSSAAATAFGLPRAFADVHELVNSPDIDLVSITVKVPHHLALVTAALEAGKHVFCEWPLGNGLAEARVMAELARVKGVVGVVGTQARVAPEVLHLRDLVAQGYVGEVLSTSLIGAAQPWGGVIDSSNAYTLDLANGATLLTIPFGHTLAALFDVLGPIAELSAKLAIRRPTSLLSDTGEQIPVKSSDQVLVAGTLESGAPISAHFYGGSSRGDGLIWRIVGTQGELQISGPSGHSQLAPLTLAGGRGDDASLEVIPLPAALAADATDGPVVGNVRRVYAALASDLRHGTHLAPSFDDAVKAHQVIAAIERAAATGHSVWPSEL